MITRPTKQQAAPDRAIPPMSYPRRVRAAVSLAWQTLRTGQYLPAVNYLQGSRDGMDVALKMMSEALAKRDGHDGGAK